MNDPLKYSPFEKNIKHLNELKTKNNGNEKNIFSNITSEYNDSLFDIAKKQSSTSNIRSKSSSSSSSLKKAEIATSILSGLSGVGIAAMSIVSAAKNMGNTNSFPNTQLGTNMVSQAQNYSTMSEGDLTQTLTTLKGDLASTNISMQNASKAREAALEILESKESEAKTLQKNIDTTNDKIADLGESYDDLKSDLSKRESSLSSANNELNAAKNLPDSDPQKMQKVFDAQKKVNEIEAKIKQLKSDMESNEKQQEELKTQLKEYKTQNGEVREEIQKQTAIANGQKDELDEHTAIKQKTEAEIKKVEQEIKEREKQQKTNNE